jgi:hypothetical protein
MRAALIGLLLAGLSCGESRPPAVLPPVPACGGFAGDPTAAIGFGQSGFELIASDGVAPQVFGPQGGSHVFVSARLRGFRAPVTLDVEARDAYSGARLGVGRVGSPSLVTGADVPADACDVRGALLLLNARFPDGAGLADLRVTARDATGITRSATQRAWIGAALTACVPGAVDGTMAPLAFASTSARRDEALTINEGARLRPAATGEVLLGAGVLGMAASAVSHSARVLDASGAVLREARAPALTGDVTVAPAMRRAAPECVAPVTLRLPVDATLGGRPLRLALTADDGHGHTRTEERVVEFVLVDAPVFDASVVDVPSVDVPSVDVPSVDVPSVDVPSVDIVDVPSVDLPVDASVVDVVDVPVVEVPRAATSGLTLRSEQSFGYGAHARELAVDGDTVYLADSNGLPVVAMASAGTTRLVHPIAPRREQHCSTASMHARSRTLVCAAGDSGFLDLIDVRDPSNPRSRPWDLNTHDPSGGFPLYEVADVEVIGDTAWLATQRGGLVRVSLDANGDASDVVRTGVGVNLVGVVAMGPGLALLDRVNGLSLHALPGLAELASVALDGPPLDLAVAGDRVAVALGSEGARVWRMTAGALAAVARVQPRCAATAVALAGDALAVACLTGVTVYDLRAATPRVVGFYPARYGMLDAAFTPRGLLVSDWYGLDLLAVDLDGVARVPDVPRAMRLRPGADARIGVRNPGATALTIPWRAGATRSGSLTLAGDGDGVVVIPATEERALDVTFGDEGIARTRAEWRAATDDPARGVVAIGDVFPTLRRTVASPYPATLPPMGAGLVMFLTVDCFLQWPQLEDMAWSRAHGATQPPPTILYLTTDDQDPFDPSFFMEAHAAGALPTFEWADYSRSVRGQESETVFVRAFEASFLMRLPGADFPHDYVIDADGVTVDTRREYRGRWPLSR